VFGWFRDCALRGADRWLRRNLKTSALTRSELVDAAQTAARIAPAQRRLDRAVALADIDAACVGAGR
jgi:hypothetical protein